MLGGVDMGDKRKITMVSLSLVLDGDFSKDAVNSAFLPAIRRACLKDGMKHLPEAWMDSIETKEMEVITK